MPDRVTGFSAAGLRPEERRQECLRSTSQLRDAGSSHERAQPRAPWGSREKWVTGKGACATQVLQRDAGSINSKELRVNKRDSPRISREIHIDRKQPLGVSLKGSPKQVLANCGLDEKSGMEHGRERPVPQDKKFKSQQAEAAQLGRQVSRSSRLMVWGT
jgi:hypothetical protein